MNNILPDTINVYHAGLYFGLVNFELHNNEQLCNLSENQISSAVEYR